MGRRPKARGRDVHGIVLLDKPQGISSNQALQKIKRLFNANRAGHTGSLDPMATGLLPICLGEATKVSAFLLDANKAYTATLQLGQSTTTGDKEGEVLHSSDVPIDWQTRLSACIESFLGEQSQVPPMFSAIKINGQPLYKLAREGVDVERKSRVITIFELKILAMHESSVDFYVKCSKGTYVRTLGEQIAEALDCTGHLTALRRVEVEPYDAHAMMTLDALNQRLEEPQSFERLDECLLPVDTALQGWPTVALNEQQAQDIVHGKAVSVRSLECPPPVGLCRLRYQDQLLAIGELSDKGALRSKRLFHLVRV